MHVIRNRDSKLCSDQNIRHVYEHAVNKNAQARKDTWRADD